MRVYPKFTLIESAIIEKSFLIILLLRLSPVIPFNVANYGLGITKAKLWIFSLASAIGIVPGTLLYVYIGVLTRAAVNAAAANDDDSSSSLLSDILLYGVGGVATVVLVVVITILGKRAFDRALAQEGETQLNNIDPSMQSVDSFESFDDDILRF